MDTSQLIAAVDQEIATLTQVRNLLAGAGARKPGRPATPFGNKPRKKRKMSASAKASIAAAQKKRWAEWHKTHTAKK